MSETFVVCAACNRHVRAASPACPFCDALREPSRERSRGSLGRLSRAAVLALSVAAGADSGCSDSTVPAVVDAGSRRCTLIGCGSSLVVRFERSSGWTEGRYRIEVDVDGSQQVCEVDLPLACSVAPACMGDYTWSPTTLGCVHEPGLQELRGLEFRYPAAPSRLSVRVLQAGRRIGGGDLAPMYSDYYVNGLGCAPACPEAAQTLALVP